MILRHDLKPTIGGGWSSLLSSLQQTPWMDAALCGGTTEPDLWTAIDRAPIKIHVAKMICAHCPVREECLEWGESNGFGGVYGGVLLEDRSIPAGDFVDVQ